MKFLNCNLYTCQKSSQSQNQEQTNFQSHMLVNEVGVKLDNKEVPQNSTTSNQQQQTSISTASFEFKQNESDTLMTRISNNKPHIHKNDNTQCLV